MKRSEMINKIVDVLLKGESNRDHFLKTADMVLFEMEEAGMLPGSHPEFEPGYFHWEDEDETSEKKAPKDWKYEGSSI